MAKLRDSQLHFCRQNMSMHSPDHHAALGGTIANAILTDRLLVAVESKTPLTRNETAWTCE